MNDSLPPTESARRRRRVQIRFAKKGDLQWIGHRDLVRALERAFRRAGLELAMSEGFHPKPKMSFPTALGIGIQATDEVMEVELYEPVDLDFLKNRLRRVMPAGLELTTVALRPEGSRKLRVERLCYEIPVPSDRQAAIGSRIAEILDQPDLQYTRKDRSEPLEVLRDIEQLELQAGHLHLVQRVSSTAAIRPREILEILGCNDLEHGGHGLTRTAVVLGTQTR